MSSVLVVGKPNCGKSLLFNRLTGLKQKVANFPGITVELKSGQCGKSELIDFPGIYSLNPLTKDEIIAVEKFQEAMKRDSVKAVLCVLDATRLERSLVISLQAQQIAHQSNKKIIFAVNMMDEIIRNHVSVDIGGLSKALEAPVFAISARTGMGIKTLENYLQNITSSPTEESFTSTSNKTITTSDKKISYSQKARELNQQFGPKGDFILKTQNSLDRFFLASFTGGISFFAVMAFLFQAIFTWAAPLMDLVESSIAELGALVSSLIPEGMASDFVNDAIFGGLGSFLVFVPQIFVLSFIIGILEDSGYLARAAIICHRPLSFFGLSGKSFVPLLSGHACSIPAIFAARTIESPKHRLLTWITIPLMSCSARLPVYGLLVSVLVPAGAGAIIGLQGLAFLALYIFGLVTALLVAALTSKTLARNESSAPFIIELPPYRVPGIRPLISRAFNDSIAFIQRAGGVIFAVTVVVWVLGYFPLGSGHLEESYLGQLGKWIAPIFEPIGVDWKYGVAILASFVAREVFVGTLGTLFGIEGADEDIEGFAGKISESGLTAASAISLLVFYVIALQCASTLAVLKKESGGYKLPTLLFFGYGILAYALAWVSYRILT